MAIKAFLVELLSRAAFSDTTKALVTRYCCQHVSCGKLVRFFHSVPIKRLHEFNMLPLYWRCLGSQFLGSIYL